jgi:uncharacterized phiE125 gp8 family phage protein
MAKTLIVPPAALPVTLAEVKAHLRVDTDDENDYLTELARAATAHAEQVSGKALITQTWRVYLDDWPHEPWIELPLAPVQTISSITVYGEDGAAGLVPAEQWQLDKISDPARLAFFEVASPGQKINGIEIELVAGFGDTGADVPDPFRRAILVLVAHWHELRGSAPDAAALGLEPAGFRRLLAPFRRPLL